jgi:hypothetical protein
MEEFMNVETVRAFDGEFPLKFVSRMMKFDTKQTQRMTSERMAGHFTFDIACGRPCRQCLRDVSLVFRVVSMPYDQNLMICELIHAKGRVGGDLNLRFPAQKPLRPTDGFLTSKQVCERQILINALESFYNPKKLAVFVET